MRVAIHQPNFMPWPGFFYKLLQSEIFVLFDTVQFPRGKSFCSRVKIKSPGGIKWLTVPVKGKGELLPIKDVQIAGREWVQKHLGTLKASYSKAPFFNSWYPGVETTYRMAVDSIADFNIQLINYLADALGAKTRIIRASVLDLNWQDTGSYILDLVKHLGGRVYVTGQGAGTVRYLDEQKFNQAGITVEMFNYVHPHYKQLWGDFVPGLSVIDILFNTGSQARDLILAGGS